MDKETFTETMNFRVKVPKLIMKLSNTYYTKLSKISKLIFNKKKTVDSKTPCNLKKETHNEKKDCNMLDEDCCINNAESYEKQGNIIFKHRGKY